MTYYNFSPLCLRSLFTEYSYIHHKTSDLNIHQQHTHMPPHFSLCGTSVAFPADGPPVIATPVTRRVHASGGSTGADTQHADVAQHDTAPASDRLYVRHTCMHYAANHWRYIGRNNTVAMRQPTHGDAVLSDNLIQYIAPHAQLRDARRDGANRIHLTPRHVSKRAHSKAHRST